MSRFHRCYYINRLLLSIIGQWPYQTRMEKYVMTSISMSFLLSLSGLELWGLIAGASNLSIVMENASPFLVNSMLFVKLVNNMINTDKVKGLLDRIAETWKLIQSEPEIEILRSYAQKGRILTLRYTAFIYIMATFYSTMPYMTSVVFTLLSTNKTHTVKFLYRLEHVLDVNTYFDVLMIHAIISIFFLMTIGIAFDTLFVICIQHACTLFEIIRYKLGCIESTDFVMLNPNMDDDDAYHILIYCIKIYNRAYEFSELLSNVFAASFLFILGNVIVVLSITTAEFILVETTLDEMIRIVASNTAQLLHIFVLSYTSQRLIDFSTDLHEVIYSCNWTSTSFRSRKLLIFMLMRVTKPCQIMAGKMYVMSLENFRAILQVSMSYFTVLTSMQ